MIKETSDLLHALDPVRFSIEVLGLKPDEWQANALRSPAKRIIFNCSRQSGKSTCAGILALHRCIFYPSSLVLVISPSLRQSGELFRIIAGLLARLPDMPKVEDNKMSFQLANGSRCLSLPGTEQTVRGYGGVSLIVVDEAARVDDALITGLSPMLATSNGRLLMLSTPWGRRGFFHQAWTEGGTDWYRYEVPASECPRISKSFLEAERRNLGEWAYAQEYCCQFSDNAAGVFAYDIIAGAFSDEFLPLFPSLLVESTTTDPKGTGGQE